MENKERINEIMNEIVSDYDTIKNFHDRFNKNLIQGAWGALGYIFHDMENKFNKIYDKIRKYKSEIENMSEINIKKNENKFNWNQMTIHDIQVKVENEIKNRYKVHNESYVIDEPQITSIHFDKEHSEYVIYLKTHGRGSGTYTYYIKCIFNYDTYTIDIFSTIGNE